MIIVAAMLRVRSPAGMVGFHKRFVKRGLSPIRRSLGMNLVSGDQYVAVVLPARLFRNEFRNRGLASTNLSRALCDAGSVTSPLIPWNSCGAYMAAVLGVQTMLYLPYCFFNIASPLHTLFLGYTGFRILKTSTVTPTERKPASVS